MLMLYWLVGILYATCLALLGAWGIHRFVLLRWLSLRRPVTKQQEHGWPTVLVQVPMYNEPRVAARIIDAVAMLDWPSIEIQILDDSTDHTPAIVASRIAHWSNQGILISHLQRSDRIGYKAGALKAGLTLSRAEFIAIFDADFLPPQDFLQRMMSSLSDPSVGMVQACWGHLNRDQNWLTRLQAIILDGHFVIENPARYRAGRFFNFNGTAGIWRRRCIEDAGGWAHDTVTEDLDLSYRAQLKGWRFVYRDDLITPAELPATVQALLTQQHRWAKGTVQTSRKLLGTILSAPIPAGIRLEAANHMLMVWAYPVVFLLTLLYPLSVLARLNLDIGHTLVLDGFAFIATTVSIGIFYATAMARAGESVRRRWWEIPAAMALGIGCAASQSLAVFEGLLSNDATFHRTPKMGNTETVRSTRQINMKLWCVHSLMSVYYLLTIVWAVVGGHWTSLPFAFLMGGGFVALAITQWSQGAHTAANTEMDVAPATK